VQNFKKSVHLKGLLAALLKAVWKRCVFRVCLKRSHHI